MNIMFPFYLEVINTLNEHGVRYLLIGGYAVIAYGYERTTGDLDLWIDPSEENKTKLLKSFQQLEYEEEDIELLDSLDFSKPIVFNIGEKPCKIDFISQLAILEFEAAYSRKKTIAIEENTEINLVHYHDLIILKMASERTQDKADVEELQRINKNEKK